MSLCNKTVFYLFDTRIEKYKFTVLEVPKLLAIHFF